MASGDVVVGYLLLKGAAVAAEKLADASAKDVPFYTGKIAAAKFFAANVLPGVSLARSSPRASNSPDGAGRGRLLADRLPRHAPRPWRRTGPCPSVRRPALHTASTRARSASARERALVRR